MPVVVVQETMKTKLLHLLISIEPIKRMELLLLPKQSHQMQRFLGEGLLSASLKWSLIICKLQLLTTSRKLHPMGLLAQARLMQWLSALNLFGHSF
jgi:hypothetical protein